MKLGKIEKFILLYLHSCKESKRSRDAVMARRKTNKFEAGWVDRTHLIFQYYQTIEGKSASQPKGTLKQAIPAETYDKLQATFTRSLQQLKEKELIYYAGAFGKKSTRRLTERRLGICPTDDGIAEIARLVSSVRRSLGREYAKMTRPNIKEYLRL